MVERLAGVTRERCVRVPGAAAGAGPIDSLISLRRQPFPAHSGWEWGIWSQAGLCASPHFSSFGVFFVEEGVEVPEKWVKIRLGTGMAVPGRAGMS